MTKRTKESVDYGPGMKSAHCGICEHYRGGFCTRIIGKIDPRMWCKLFEKQKAGA